jgi:phosphonopyruvate decarboxylase
MGYANAIAHGVALISSRTVYVLDGDGALLMHMGNLATIGAIGTKNFVHVLMDNGTYDTTGGQPTVSGSVDFTKIATACGYRNTSSCTDLDDFRRAVRQKDNHGPRFIHIRIRKGSLENLGRPTISPESVAQRFRQFTSSIPALALHSAPTRKVVD